MTEGLNGDLDVSEWTAGSVSKPTLDTDSIGKNFRNTTAVEIDLPAGGIPGFIGTPGVFMAYVRGLWLYRG